MKATGVFDSETRAELSKLVSLEIRNKIQS
jgi:hypothetical protein